MKKLPLTIECDLAIVAAHDKRLKTKSRILGAKHGDFILIEEPVFRVNERLSASPEGKYICMFFHDGEVYRFRTKVKQTLGGGLMLVDYPAAFEVEAVRKFHRVQVNVEARFQLAFASDTQSAIVSDISEGGACTVVSGLLHVSQNMGCKLDFTLPDKQNVVGLEAKIRSIQHSTLKKTTELGLQFCGPSEQIAKIAAFCRYCMFFKV